MRIRLLSIFISFIFGVFVGIVITKYQIEQSLFEINEEFTKKPSASGGVKTFRNFDATQFKEPHAWLGDKITILYDFQIFGESNFNREPVEAIVKQNLSQYRNEDQIVLAIQGWPMFIENKQHPQAKEHAAWYLKIVIWAKEILPNTKVGILGIPNSPWNVLNNVEQLMPEYINGTQLLWPVMLTVDAIYPMFDVPGLDLNKQQKMLEILTSISKSFNKPIYPIMWHQGTGSTLLGNVLPDNVIELSCSYIQENTDGVIWWSGQNEKWNGGVWYPAANKCFTNKV